MARILAISSQVARGHVGLSAALPALQGLRQDVIALPTVLLSNHPGHQHVAGLVVPPADLTRMLDAMAANGWLSVVDSVLTGYLPSAAHVAFAAEAIARVRARKPAARVIVDPVLGDNPKGLYLDPVAAAGVREHLVPLADVVTPNLFELGWLTGVDVSSIAGIAQAAATLSASAVCVTSACLRCARSAPTASPTSTLTRKGGPTTVAEQEAQAIVSLLIAEGALAAAAVPWRQSVPRGTGDLFAGLLAGYLAGGREIAEAFARAIAGVEVVVAASAGQDELALGACLPALANVAPWPLEPIS